MPNYYNRNTYQEFIDKRDYSGAADYLESCEAPESSENRVYVYDQVNKLREKAEIENAKLEKMTPDAQQAYHFISGLNGDGIIPHQQWDQEGNPIDGTANSWGDRYLSYINALTINSNGESHKINRMIFSFGSDEAFSNYLSNIGVNDKEEAISKYNIEIKTNNDGRREIYVPVRISGFIDLYDKFQKTRENDRADNTQNFYYTGVNMAVATTPAVLSSKEINKKYSISVIADNNKRYTNENDMPIIRSKLDKALYLVNNARKLQQQELEAASTVTTIEDLHSTGFLGIGHAKAYEDWQKHIISDEHYNNILKDRKLRLGNKIAAIDTKQKPVYAFDDKNNKLVLVTDPDELKEIQNRIVSTNGTDQQKYELAYTADKYGTVFTISTKLDQQGRPYGDPVRYFVEDFLGDVAKKYFESDTKTLAVKKAAELRRWNYGKTLHDGTYVGHDKNSNTYYTKRKDERGNYVKTAISQEEALNALHKEIITDRAVRLVLSKTHKDGSPELELKNGQLVPIDLNSRLSSVIGIGINELYPKEVYSDERRLLEYNNLYRNILRLVSYYNNINNNTTE